MSKDHSEIRLSSFQVCDELFNKSHTFRELVANNFQKIIALGMYVAYMYLIIACIHYRGHAYDVIFDLPHKMTDF